MSVSLHPKEMSISERRYQILALLSHVLAKMPESGELPPEAEMCKYYAKR